MLSDCIKCWNTPCTCGWELRHYSISYLERQKGLIERAIQFKKEHPHVQFHNDFDANAWDEAFYKFVTKSS